ncbi:MAG TPA: glycosyltransferase family 4 protein [Methanotrichaceae archaeon]|nr:glycosyltransferase family 4 protein [Methanotrichaceae archaeon]
MMKIAQVCHRYYPNVGGVERHVQEISKRLAEKFDVEVISADRSRDRPQIEEIDGIKVTRFRSVSPNNAYFIAPQISSYIKKSDFDIVHAHNYHALPALFASFGSKNKKFVFNPHYHGVGSTPFRDLLNKPYKIVGSTIFNRSNKIICDSNYEKNLVEKNFGFKDNIEIIPSGVDLKSIRSVKPFELDEKFMLYLGRLDKYKNIQCAIKAMKYLPEDFHFYIGGKGENFSELKSMIGKLDLDSRVKLLGFVPEEDKYRWMKTCDVFVNLSGVEAFGITVLEALASGAPAIVNAEGGLSEFAEKFGGVRSVQPEKISAKVLAQEIERSIEKTINDDLNGYDWRSIIKKIEGVYKNL